MLEDIALDKEKQSKFSKKAKRIKNEVQGNPQLVQETVKTRQKNNKSTRGVVYIGHIPHGFYEQQMRQYFKQFGRVCNVIVCRSKRTNKCKGFGFVQFENQDVAKVAAETMDNYLMFKRRLIAKYIPPEKVKPVMQQSSFWITNPFQKFKSNREEHLRRKNTNISNEQLVKSSASVLKRINKKNKKLMELGINFNFNPVDVPSSTHDKKLVKK